MSQSKAPRTIPELVTLMSGLETMYGELTQLLEAKVEAMRRADVEGMSQLGAKEIALTQRMHERDVLRKQVLERIGKGIGLNSTRSRTLTVSQLTAHLDESQRALLLDAAKRLRTAVFRSARVNRLAGAVARDVLEHMRWVFASVRPKVQAGGDYGGARMEFRILDAVG